jgi:long-chain acyl-CoA synthetase
VHQQDRPGGVVTDRLEETNVAHLVSRQAQLAPDRVALVQPGPNRRTMTWAELDSMIDKVAAGLAAHGLIAGHRVALSGPNSIELLIAYFAVLRAGFVAVPLDPSCSADELRSDLAATGARLLLSAAPISVAGVAVLPLTPDALAALGAEATGPVSSPQDREALALLAYTAGTAGDARIVMLSHRALLGHLRNVEPLDVIDADTVALALLPMFGIFGLNAVVGTWAMAGGRLVIMDGFSDSVFDVIVAEQVNNLPLAPALIYKLLHHDQLRTSLASVRTVISGAAPLPSALLAAFTERTGLRVDQGYGLTEAAPGVSVTLGGDLLGPGHVGRVLPGVAVRIGAGEDDSEPAEIFIRGENLFSGYWPDGRDGPDAEGWFATGDIGYLRGGELFLVDRARELIVVNGFHVYPAEIEDVISDLPGVAAVAVLGRPADGRGDQVVAFVVGRNVEPETVLDHCAKRLPKFKRPTELHLVADLPRGATGKIRKGALRRMLDDPLNHQTTTSSAGTTEDRS